jgi:hypothetical protein
MLTDSRRLAVRHRAVWLAALCCVVASCAGGSGSSGFDIAAENAAIDRALGSQHCTENAGLTICASTGEIGPVQTPEPTATATVIPSANDHPTPPTTTTPTAVFATATTTRVANATATPTHTATLVPTPTVTPSPAAPDVSTNLGTTDQLPCVSTHLGCSFVLRFMASGFPSTAAYRVALRARNPDGAWRIEAAVGNSTTLFLQPLARQYQIAILVFLTDPGFVPDRVGALAETGADYAFVTGMLTPTVVGTE